MANATYSTTRESVETIFFPVVPDSFMKRGAGISAIFRQPSNDHGPADTQDQPVLPPQDPWSF